MFWVNGDILWVDVWVYRDADCAQWDCPVGRWHGACLWGGVCPVCVAVDCRPSSTKTQGENGAQVGVVCWMGTAMTGVPQILWRSCVYSSIFLSLQFACSGWKLRQI